MVFLSMYMYWAYYIATRHGRFINIVDLPPYNAVCTLQLHLRSALMTGWAQLMLYLSITRLQMPRPVFIRQLRFLEQCAFASKSQRSEKKRRKNSQETKEVGAGYSALGIKSQDKPNAPHPARKRTPMQHVLWEERKNQSSNERTKTPWGTRVSCEGEEEYMYKQKKRKKRQSMEAAWQGQECRNKKKEMWKI